MGLVVWVEVEGATLTYNVADVDEGKRVVSALAGRPFGRHYAEFDYDGGTKRACVLRSALKFAGMMTEDEARTEEAMRHGARVED